MLRLLYWSVFIVFLCAATAVFGKPPQALFDQMNQGVVVYDKKCNVKSLNLYDVECIIMWVEKTETVWVVLFDDEIEISHVIAVGPDRIEHILWETTEEVKIGGGQRI